ncbi:MAG: hypothetical protein ABH875_07725 [Candidatus Omnitrophota bacterium]
MIKPPWRGKTHTEVPEWAVTCFVCKKKILKKEAVYQDIFWAYVSGITHMEHYCPSCFKETRRTRPRSLLTGIVLGAALSFKWLQSLFRIR